MDKINQIKVYGPDGRHLRTIGKKGQGPGELQSPSRMTMTADGNLCFLDFGQQPRLHLFARGDVPEGNPVRGLAASSASSSTPGASATATSSISRAGFKDVLLKFDSQARQGRHRSRPLCIVDNPSEQMSPVEMFRLIYQVDPKDRIVWASTGAYELNVVDADGKPVRKILRESREEILQPGRQGPADQGVFRRTGPAVRASNPSSLPTSRSSIISFSDDEGRYYVRTYEKDDAGAVLLRCFRRGGAVSSARSPFPESELLGVGQEGQGLHLPSLENEAGTPQVKRYAVVWE